MFIHTDVCERWSARPPIVPNQTNELRWLSLLTEGIEPRDTIEVGVLVLPLRMTSGLGEVGDAGAGPLAAESYRLLLPLLLAVPRFACWYWGPLNVEPFAM